MATFSFASKPQMSEPNRTKPRGNLCLWPTLLLCCTCAAKAANLDQPVNLPNLIFVGRQVTPDIAPVQVPPLSFAGRQEAVLPPITLPTLQFSGGGDPKRIDPVTTPTLNFKGRLPK
jgi:hypothetical protein